MAMTTMNTEGPGVAAATPLLAAIDLGSNSFHLLVAAVSHGEMRPLETRGEKVQLAAGLRDGVLDSDAIARGFETLTRFRQVLDTFTPDTVRVVGTNTLRAAKNVRSFIGPAQAILGHPIEIVSGREEARLIYLGVAHSEADDDHARLVVDIGGGSTEIIVGKGPTPLHLESLSMGCVTYSNAHFANGILTDQNFFDAKTAAALELIPVRGFFRRQGWDAVIGTSGTAKAIARILADQRWSNGTITREGIEKLQAMMIAAGSIAKLQLPNVKPDRMEVLAGGLAVMTAIFDVLKLDVMTLSDSALREGIVYDLIGRMHHHDARDASITALMQRFNVDPGQSKRVTDTVDRLLLQVDVKEKQEAEYFLPFLRWAAQVHEIGLAVAHQQHHKHGAYLMENADLSGFSSSEQKLLAMFVRLHRRKLSADLMNEIEPKSRDIAMRLVVLLRLAVLLNRGRSDEAEPDVAIEVAKRRLSLRFTPGWEKDRPLLRADLKAEQKRLANAKFELTFA